MMKRALILSLLAVGVAYGQSGVFNLPYKPRPRILIPHIVPEKYTGVTESVFGISTTNYTFSMGVVTQIVNGVTSVVSVVKSVSAITNFLSITNVSVIENPYHSLKFCDFVLKCVSQNTNLYAVNLGNAKTPILYIYVSSDNMGLGVSAEPFFDGNATVFYQNTGLAWPEQALRNLAPAGGIPIQVLSTNSACAIEVYPDISKFRSWMKQGNKDVKWMCALSNGIDFYRDQAGNLIWFNVEVEWVDKVPEEGKW